MGYCALGGIVGVLGGNKVFQETGGHLSVVD
jgi:hypothetical protein